MPQVIDVNNKKSTKILDKPNTEKVSVKEKTKFQEEWERSIPADIAFDELLTYVKDLWKK